MKDRCRCGDGDESAVGETGGAAVGGGCAGCTAQRMPTGNVCSTGLAVGVLTALGERDGAVRDGGTPRRRGAADDERKPNALFPCMAIFWPPSPETVFD